MKVDELLMVIIGILSLIILYKIYKGSLIEGLDGIVETTECDKLNGLDKYNCLYKNGKVDISDFAMTEQQFYDSNKSNQDLKRRIETLENTLIAKTVKCKGFTENCVNVSQPCENWHDGGGKKGQGPVICQKSSNWFHDCERSNIACTRETCPQLPSYGFSTCEAYNTSIKKNDKDTLDSLKLYRKWEYDKFIADLTGTDPTIAPTLPAGITLTDNPPPPPPAPPPLGPGGKAPPGWKIDSRGVLRPIGGGAR